MWIGITLSHVHTAYVQHSQRSVSHNHNHVNHWNYSDVFEISSVIDDVRK